MTAPTPLSLAAAAIEDAKRLAQEALEADKADAFDLDLLDLAVNVDVLTVRERRVERDVRRRTREPLLARALLEASARIEAAPKLYDCPDCAFSFDAAHAIVNGKPTCPCCEEHRLRARIAKLEAALGELLDVVEDSEMSSRNVEPHKYEAILEDAEKRAQAALAKGTP